MPKKKDMDSIYFDHAATTPIDKRVLQTMMPYLTENYGNANSAHQLGRTSKVAIEDARETVAALINAEPSEIIFTSGGTESDNAIIKGAIAGTGKKEIITSPIEHHAVLHSAEALESEGVTIKFLEPNEEGVITAAQVADAISDKTAIVTLMHVNNEIGSINPIKEISEVCRKQGVPFHSDTVQSIGKMPAFLEELLQEGLAPKVPWQDKLRLLQEHIVRNDYNWNRPNRKMLAHGVVMPSLWNNQVGTLVFGIDSSGSVSNDELSQFLAEENAILELFDFERCFVVFWDAEVQAVDEYEKSDLPLEPRAVGRGGTRVSSLFDWIDENDIEPAALVVLSDMMIGDFPNEPPSYPTIWVRSSQHGAEPPFGDLARAPKKSPMGNVTQMPFAHVDAAKLHTDRLLESLQLDKMSVEELVDTYAKHYIQAIPHDAVREKCKEKLKALGVVGSLEGHLFCAPIIEKARTDLDRDLARELLGERKFRRCLRKTTFLQVNPPRAKG